MVLDMPQPTFAMAWSTWDGLPLPARLVLYVLFWPLLELLFIFRVRRYLRQRTLQAIAHHVEDTAEVLRFWSGVLEEEDVEYVVRGWFLGEGRMRRENVMDLIGWSISAENDCRAAHRRLAADIVDRMVEIVGSEKIPEGRNPNLRCMTHTLEPLDRCWKPLGFYLANSTARELGACVLRHFGFVLRREGALEYWFHAGDEDGADRSAAALPLVVLHGVGGLVPYLPLLLQLRWSQPRWPLLVPLLPHCSIRTPEYEPPPPLDSTVLVAELAAAVRRVAAARGQPPRAAFLAHSLGTAVFASFAKAHPALVARAALVDPICFLLYHKDVVYNFLYRQPKPIGHRRQALHLGYWFRLLLHYVLTQVCAASGRSRSTASSTAPFHRPIAQLSAPRGACSRRSLRSRAASGASSGGRGTGCTPATCPRRRSSSSRAATRSCPRTRCTPTSRATKRRRPESAGVRPCANGPHETPRAPGRPLRRPLRARSSTSRCTSARITAGSWPTRLHSAG